MTADIPRHRARLGMHSKNSSNPPSSDGYAKLAPKSRPSFQASNRARGGEEPRTGRRSRRGRRPVRGGLRGGLRRPGASLVHPSQSSQPPGQPCWQPKSDAASLFRVARLARYLVTADHYVAVRVGEGKVA
ncbi:MAG: DUF6444 domain-containing protein [Acidimicrobiales bacterium]